MLAGISALQIACVEGSLFGRFAPERPPAPLRVGKLFEPRVERTPFERQRSSRQASRADAMVRSIRMADPEHVGRRPDAATGRRRRTDHPLVAIGCAIAIASAACSALLGLDAVPVLDEEAEAGSVDAAIDARGPPVGVEDAGVVFGVTLQSARGLSALYRWEPSTPNVAPKKVATIGCADGGAFDIAFSADGKLYVTAMGTLIEVDPASGSCARTQPLSPDYFVFNLASGSPPEDAGGEFLVGCGGRADAGVSEPPNKCLRIDTTTGLITETGTLSVDGGRPLTCLGDLVVVGAQTFVNITQDGIEQLAELDTQTCQIKSLRPLGVSGVSGLAYASGRLYAFAREGTIFTVDPTRDAGYALVSPPLDWGGAASPRPPSNL
jgi:hypothetical protein